MSTKHLSYALITSLPMLIIYSVATVISALRIERNKRRYSLAAIGFCILFITTLASIIINFEFNQDGAFGRNSGSYSAIPELFILISSIAHFAAFICLVFSIFAPEKPIQDQDAA